MAIPTSLAVALHFAAQGAQVEATSPWFWTAFGALGLVVNTYLLRNARILLRS